MTSGSASFRPLKVRFSAVSEKNADRLVIGRDSLVEDFWSRIRGGSLRVLAERRMGKTWVMRLALARRPSWVAAQFMDLQGVESASQFVMQLNKACHQNGMISADWLQRVTDWFRRVLRRIEGQSLGKVTVPILDTWSSLLRDTCCHMIEKHPKKIVLLIFDELPFFLDRLMKAGQEKEAIQVLDGLRALRHEMPMLRMVFCGSLGLHIVLGNLHDQKYTGQPVNDMPPLEVTPLNSEMACHLSGCLLMGEKISCSDIKGVAESVAEASSGVPFYVQHIVSKMSRSSRDLWTPEDVRLVPGALFTESNDPAEFRYYDKRLGDYYPEDIVEKSRTVLDVISGHSDGLPFDQVLNLVRHRPGLDRIDPRGIMSVLDLLRDDFYLSEFQKAWRFKLPIVRDWWYQSRGRHT